MHACVQAYMSVNALRAYMLMCVQWVGKQGAPYVNKSSEFPFLAPCCTQPAGTKSR